MKRLLKNKYRFTISERAKKNLHEAMESGNNIIAFMQSSGYVILFFQLADQVHAVAAAGEFADAAAAKQQRLRTFLHVFSHFSMVNKLINNPYDLSLM